MKKSISEHQRQVERREGARVLPATKSCETLMNKIATKSHILTKLEPFFRWALSRSIWLFPFGTACCGMELIAVNASRYDLMRFGVLPRSTPRQADLMTVAGTITEKMAPLVKRLYEQMPEPKYVIAVGSCAISGGPYYYDAYSVVKGVDKIIPVDVYIPGCPPRPEALIHGFMQLQEKIRKAENER